MNGSLIAAAVWLFAANVMAMIPSKDNLWQRAYFLIAVAAPLTVWLVLQNGWLIGLVFLIAAASLLRWPLIYLIRWVRRCVRGRVEPENDNG